MNQCMNCGSGSAAEKVCSIIFASLGVFFLVDGVLTHTEAKLVQAFISYILAFLFFGIAKTCLCCMGKMTKPASRRRRR